MPCSCCAGQALDIFGKRAARHELSRYLRKGLTGDAALIASWAEETDVVGATVLDIGGGVGQIQAELLRRGAAFGRVVEVVAAYERPAAELVERVDVADRSTFVLVDLLEDPDALEPGDVVVLRRVVCCSPEGPELLGRAATKTRRTLLASYPRDRALVRMMFGLSNLALRLLRKRFRAFVHPVAQLDQAVSPSGLRRVRTARGFVWETAQFDVAS